MPSVKGSRVRSHKACARSACARRATVGWPRQACRTWRPPRPSTLIASQLGWPSVRSLRPASRVLPPLRPEHFANGVRYIYGHPPLAEGLRLQPPGARRATIGRFKPVIGNELRSRTEQRQAIEVAIAVIVLNCMLDFGPPKSVRIT